MIARFPRTTKNATTIGRQLTLRVVDFVPTCDAIVVKRLFSSSNYDAKNTTPSLSSSKTTIETQRNDENHQKLPFRPRRRTPEPLLTKPIRKHAYVKQKKIESSPEQKDNADHSPSLESCIEFLRRKQNRLTNQSVTKKNGPTVDTLGPDAESFLRAVDYLASPLGSTEDLMGARKAITTELPLCISDEKIYKAESDKVMNEIDQMIAEENKDTFPTSRSYFESESKPDFPKLEPNYKPENPILEDGDDLEDDPNRRAYGPWSETVITVDRVQKVTRGGTTVSYRALCIGGNLNGCAGFGSAKAYAPAAAVAAACRKTRRNIVFLDRYKTSGLTHDVAGKHNSCRVHIRCAPPNRGPKGSNPLVTLILNYFGVTDFTAKTHGNRNPFNVVRATFKAVMTHEGMECIALKRGKRLLNLERAKRLQI